MSYMPSASYVAQALFTIGADTEWEDAPDEVRDAHLVLARTAIAAVVSWQAVHRSNGLQRYCFEPLKDEHGPYAKWGIYDRKDGLLAPLGAIHDPLLAQQIVDDLNRRHDFKGPFPAKTDGDH